MTKLSSKDIDLSNSESSLYTLGTLPPNRNELCSILAFKPLTSLKGNSRGARVTGFGINSSSISTVKAGTKSL